MKMQKFNTLILICALFIPVLPGCASKYGEQKTVVNYYPACYRPIQELRESEHNVTKTTVGGAVVGALGGALIGLLASGGKWEGAAIGAATGGVAGTMAGNIYARKQQEADDNVRLASYLQDIDGDISNLDIVGAAARSSLQCYDRQFALLIKEIKSKSIDKQAAQARYGEISAGREEAITLLGNAVTQARNLDQQYEQAFVEEQRQVQAKAMRTGNVNEARKNVAAIQTAKKKKSMLAQKTVTLEREKTVAQQSTSEQVKELQVALADARI